MKLRVASLTVLCLLLAAVPASAQYNIYDNVPINGTTDARTINSGYIVSSATRSYRRFTTDMSLSLVSSWAFGNFRAT